MFAQVLAGNRKNLRIQRLLGLRRKFRSVFFLAFRHSEAILLLQRKKRMQSPFNHVARPLEAVTPLEVSPYF